MIPSVLWRDSCARAAIPVPADFTNRVTDTCSVNRRLPPYLRRRRSPCDATSQLTRVDNTARSFAPHLSSFGRPEHALEHHFGFVQVLGYLKSRRFKHESEADPGFDPVSRIIFRNDGIRRAKQHDRLVQIFLMIATLLFCEHAAKVPLRVQSDRR